MSDTTIVEYLGFLLRADSSELLLQGAPFAPTAQRYTSIVHIESLSAGPAIPAVSFRLAVAGDPLHSDAEALDAAIQLGQRIVEEACSESRGSSSERLHVLVVEDQPDLLAATVALLELSDFTVRSAPSARAALHLLSGPDEIDVLFTDIVMPGMTGIELARQAVQHRPDLRILLTSGDAMGHPIPSHWPLLRKPYGISDLVTALRRA